MPVSTIGPAALDSTAAAGNGGFQIPTGTTAQRPVSATVGTTRWNTTTASLEVFIGNGNWTTLASSNYTISYVVVAGGGSGNFGFINDTQHNGGGGGAGGLLFGTASVFPGQTMTATVGGGGAFVAYIQDSNVRGSNTTLSGSMISTQTAIGGGGGGMQSRAGSSGGSGGGGGGGNGVGAGGAGTAGQGNNGAAGTQTTNGAAGGGGGYSGAGGVTAGGAGYTVPIIGGTYAAGGNGGNGGGFPGNATANSGNGGSGTYNQNTAGSGGSGIVLIYYLGVQKGTGGVITSSNGYTVHSFTTSGTYTA